MCYPPPFRAAIVAANRTRRKLARGFPFINKFMVGLSGLEPETSSLSVTRSNQLSYRPVVYCNQNVPLNDLVARAWWSIRDSNPGPPACKAGALSQLS